MNGDAKALSCWLTKHTNDLTDHQRLLAWRYCNWYSKVTDYPIGRGIAKFMILFNKRNKNIQHFTREEINFYYYY